MTIIEKFNNFYVLTDLFVVFRVLKGNWALKSNLKHLSKKNCIHRFLILSNHWKNNVQRILCSIYKLLKIEELKSVWLHLYLIAEA